MPKERRVSNRKRRHMEKVAKGERPVFPSPLLRLPAELRNRIYELLFHVPSGVTLDWVAGKSGRRRKPVILSKDDGRLVNQSKYASRQLYQETAGIEIKYSTLALDDSSIHLPITRFFQFTMRCCAETLQWLKRVVIHVGAETQETNALIWLRNNIKDIADLLRFCAENPRTFLS
jgi:hypothetical protein